MDTLSYKTKSRRKEDVERKWYVIDAENQVVGRMCTRIATILKGKHKADFTPHVDTGDCIIVINADKVRFTGKKMQDKRYVRYSGYPGGQKKTSPAEYMAKRPEFVVENAVKGMLPKNRLGRQMIKKLHIYTGTEHPHGAQSPEKLEID